MKLIVVYDNEAKEGLIKGWGFSCYIDTGEHKILFDAGWDGQVLLQNMKLLGIDVHAIDILVLSHQHWDHIGGLATFLFQNPRVNVYLPASFSVNLKKEIASRVEYLHEIKGAQNICNGIYTIGELGTDIKEQSLVIETEKGFYIITGCAHPGLKNILSSSSELGKVIGILGGLHADTDYDLLRNLEFIGAGHCTAHKKEIMDLFPGTYRNIFAGFEIYL